MHVTKWRYLWQIVNLLIIMITKCTETVSICATNIIIVSPGFYYSGRYWLNHSEQFSRQLDLADLADNTKIMLVISILVTLIKQVTDSKENHPPILEIKINNDSRCLQNYIVKSMWP